MNRDQRTEYLSKKLSSEKPDAGTMNVAYKQVHVEPMAVYKLDLRYLVYNQYNGRIGTLAKAYEAENGKIDAETKEGRSLIEGFLWDSQVEKNKRTMENLALVGQRDAGIVTLDGVIIDGNRRASLLARNARKNKQKPVFFNAVILPDRMGDDNIREIKRLETQYQMGLDEKVGYNALEKYLQIQDLHDNGFRIPDEVSKLMNYEETEIEKFWEVKQLMDEYLAALGYEDMYTRLDRAEDWFWKLQEGIRRFDPSRGSGISGQVDWPYTENDLIDMKLIMFDYIRATREADGEMLGGGQAFRDICSAGKTGFFKHKKIWEEFRDQHFNDFNNVEEKTIDEYREANPGESMTRILKDRDRDFSDKVEGNVKRNFHLTKSRINTENTKDKPKELLEAALSKLLAIDEESSIFRDICSKDSTIKEILVQIGKKQFDLKKVAEKRTA